MIKCYHGSGGVLTLTVDPSESHAGLESAVWIDMIEPTAAEEDMIERLLRIDVPTREDMDEIESSSRLYIEQGTVFMTANILSLPQPAEPVLAPVTFILIGNRLVTIRYHYPRPFETFAEKVQKSALGCTSGETVLIALFETLVDRLADILEGEGRRLDLISADLFRRKSARPTRRTPRGPDLPAVLDGIGQIEDLNAKLRDSLTSIERLAGFLNLRPGGNGNGKEDRARAKTLQRDLRSLQEFAATHAQKLGFLLNATLGLINIRQADIIKIFSVVAFVFLPPTLIASIYGMNFEFMPELHWRYGYPLSLGLMAISAALPYLYFRKKGWL